MMFRRIQLGKSLAGLLSQPAKCALRAFSTVAFNEDEREHFKAAVLHPDKKSLAIETMVDHTQLEDGMVRIGVEYCSVTNTDYRCLREFDVVTPPYIPGSEFGGKILEVGANCVQKLKPGDNVAVLSDEIHIGGGMSQQCVVDANICIPLEDKISVRDAVTVLRDFGNALLAFTKYCPLQENDDIIVIVGPGGNGLAAIEIASKIYKANVFVVFDTSSVQALIGNEAVYRAVNAQFGHPAIYKFLDRALKNKKFKAVYDTTGSNMLHVVFDFIDPNGYVLTDDTFFSAETCELPFFNRKMLQNKNKKVNAKARAEARAAVSNEWLPKVQVVNLAKYHNEPILFNKIVNEVFSMFAEGKIQPYISGTYSLKDVNKAVSFIQRKICMGKVLVKTGELKGNPV